MKYAGYIVLGCLANGPSLHPNFRLFDEPKCKKNQKLTQLFKILPFE